MSPSRSARCPSSFRGSIHAFPGWILAATLAAAGLGSLPAAASAQARYTVQTTGDIVVLRDTRDDITVSVMVPLQNAYEMVVKGHDVIRKTFATVTDFRAKPGLNGIPLLWPYANRLDEQAFYANGRKYSFDLGLGNTGRGAIPIHGFLQSASEWQLIEARASPDAAWITSRLDFYRIPSYMKQFPFAHTIVLTYRLADGMLEVRTRLENLSSEPMPVAIGFHPYFQLTDSPRDDWTLAIGARTHWLLDSNTIPTGQTQPITALLPEPQRVAVRDVVLDDVFTDLERDANGRAMASLIGKAQRLDVLVGPNYRCLLVLSRPTGGRGGPASATARGTVAFEPMAAISNALNLAHRGLYRDLQSVAPGGVWEESFWIRPSGF